MPVSEVDRARVSQRPCPLRSSTTSGLDVYILEAECVLWYIVNQGNIHIYDRSIALYADRSSL
jgi:hypothetical protein